MIATHYILMAVPQELLADAIAMACQVGPAGPAEAGSFVVALRDSEGRAWWGMCTAADQLLIAAINQALAGRLEAAGSARWATVEASGSTCIAGSHPGLVGQVTDWPRFLENCGLVRV